MIVQEQEAIDKAVEAITGDIGALWITLAAVLVFFMQAGFTLVEIGFTRSKNSGNIIMKNVMDLAVGSIMFWAVGYAIMYGSDLVGGGFLGPVLRIRDIYFLVPMIGTICFSKLYSVPQLPPLCPELLQVEPNFPLI